jgi:hypothetical protein
LSRLASDTEAKHHWVSLSPRGMLSADDDSLEGLWAYLCQQRKEDEFEISVLPLQAVPDDQLASALKDYSPSVDILALLPPGYHRLAKQNRLSMAVISLLAMLGRYDMHLHHDPPAGGLKREGRCIEPIIFRTRRGAPVRNAANLSAVEAIVRILLQPSLAYVERMLCNGLLFLCLDMTRAEKRSHIYNRQIEGLFEQMLDAPFDDNDPAATNLYAWMCTEAAASMLPPRVESIPKNFKDDTRFKLMMKVVRHFSTRTSVEEFCNTMKTFVYADHCVVAMVNAWNIGLSHMQ